MLDTARSPAAVPSLDDALATLRRVWGFDAFVGRQEEAVQATLEGRDTLVVFPTGAGKSITYQLPALMLEGTAVVVSPLIALMKDQVDALRGNGVAAGALNSAMPAAARNETVRALLDGSMKLLYMSPEGLLTESTIALLRQCRISFFAIDEAHCISHWGHDFRAEYRELGRLREVFGEVPVHACTATATPQVSQDILRNLALRAPLVLESSFDRPNLTYRFVPRSNTRKQVEAVLDRHRDAAGIVYCLRRADVEEMARHLVTRGWKALPYHAGMSAEDRRRNQEAFSSEQTDIVVATVAFGMGIDRSNVRFVIHTGMPKSVEHYQQEAGRAGRDGLPSECVLFYSGQDLLMWQQIMGPIASEADRSARDKTTEMYRLCRALTCRHRALVRYFGQDYPDEPCGACDYCLGEYEMLTDSVTAARKILSCVARLRERFGAKYVAEVLKGARSEKIVKNGHHELSTHGLLSDHPAEAIGDWIDQLIACGFLRRDDGEYPTIGLTPEGHELMRESKGTIALSTPRTGKPSKAERRAARDEDLPPAHADLFEQLRLLRRRLAVERGVPPYVIFSDAHLMDMARRCPTTPAQFLQVKGVGERKAADLGPHFLPAIEDWLASNPRP